MNPIQLFLEALNWVLGVLAGIGLNPDRLGVTVLFFGVGWLYGKLTRRVGFWKLIFLVYFGAYLFALLAEADPLIVWGFLFGILTNHAYLYRGIFSWARSLGDVVFAMRYRRAFEDIRKREAELDEREEQLRRQARQQARQQGQSDTQKQWQQQSRARQQQEAHRGGSTGSGSQNNSRQEKPTGSSGNGLRGQYLKVMGLDPSKNYSKDDLKRAYRKRAKETHPDLGGTESAFRNVSGAYEWLVNSTSQ